MVDRRGFLALLGVAVAATTAGAMVTLTPFFGSKDRQPTIYFGADTCEWCRMVISDRRFAAAYFSELQRKWHKFDDIGCLVNYLLQEGADTTSTIYVSDYSKGVLIDALAAHYVSTNPRLLTTPMGYGVVALEDLEAARALASSLSGQVLTFPELLKMFKD